MKHYGKFLCAILFFLVASAAHAQKTTVTIEGPQSINVDDLGKGASRVTAQYTGSDGIVQNSNQDINSLRSVVEIKPGSAIEYKIEHKSNYAFRAWNLQGISVTSEPTTDAGYTQTTFKFEGALFNAGENVTIGIELIQQYMVTVKAPAGISISAAYPSGTADDKPLNVTEGTSQTIRINKGGKLDNLTSNPVAPGATAIERTIFKEWIELPGTSVFGFADPFNVNDYNTQSLPVNATGDNLATNATLTVDTEKQIKITIKTPVTRSHDGDAAIGGTFGDFSYFGSPLNIDDNYALATQALTGQTFTTDQFLWMKSGSDIAGLAATPAAMAGTGRFMFYEWQVNGIPQASKLLKRNFTPVAGDEITPVFVRQYKVTVTTLPDFTISGNYFTTTNTGGIATSADAALSVTDPAAPAEIYIDSYKGKSPAASIANLYQCIITGTGATRNAYVVPGGAERTIATLWTGCKTNAPKSDNSDEAVIASDDQQLSFTAVGQYKLTVGAQINGTVSFNANGVACGLTDAENPTTALMNISRINALISGLYWIDKDSEVTDLAVTPVLGSVFTGYSGTIYNGERKTSIDADKKFVQDISGDLNTTIVLARTLTVHKPVSGTITVKSLFGITEIDEQVTPASDADLVVSVNDGADVEITYAPDTYTDASTERYFFKTWASVPDPLTWITGSITTDAGKFTIAQDVTIGADLHHQFKLSADAATANVFENGTVSLTAYTGAPANSDEFINAAQADVPFGAGDYVWIQEEATDAITVAATGTAPYKFLKWTGTTNAAQIPASAFAMPEARTLGALFIEQYDLVVTCPDGAENIVVNYVDGHLAQMATVVPGTAQTLKVNVATEVTSAISFNNSATERASLKNWVVTPAEAAADGLDATPLTFTMPAQNATLTAELNKQYQVLVYIPAQGTGSMTVNYKENGTDKEFTAVYKSPTAPAYEEIWVDAATYPVITALPASGYGLEEWKRSLYGISAYDFEIINEKPDQFEVNSPKELEVSFERQYKLTVNIPDEGAFFLMRYYRAGGWNTEWIHHDTPSTANSFGVRAGTYAVISAYTDADNNTSHSNTIDFVQWTGALEGTNQPESGADFNRGSNIQGFVDGGINTILMNAERSVGAVFQTPTRKLVVNEIKHGTIQVTYTHGGYPKEKTIDSKSEEKTIEADAHRYVTLLVTPDANYAVDKSFFANIPGVLINDRPDGSIDVAFPLNDDITLSPIFTALFGELTVEPFANGAITLTYTYNNVPDQTVTITPTTTARTIKVSLGTEVAFAPAMTDYPNYELEKWIGNIDASGKLTMVNATETTGALFRMKAPRFTVAQTSDDNKVKVEYIRHGIAESRIVDNNGNWDVDADLLSTVKLTALPGANTQFVSWSGLELDKTAAVSFVMNESIASATVTANFRTGTHKVTVEAPANGSLKIAYTGYNSAGAQTTYADQMVTPQSGTRTFDVIDGTNVTIDVVAAENYQFAGWKDGSTTDAGQRTFNVNGDLVTGTLFINRENNLAVGTALDGTALMGSTSVVYLEKGATRNATVTNTAGDYKADQSAKVQLMAKAEDKYEFISWSGIPSDNRNATVEFVMDGAAKSVTPNFRKQTRSLTVNAPVNGDIQVTYMGYTTATALSPVAITETVNAQTGTRVFRAVLDAQVTAAHTADRTYEFVTFTGFDDNANGTLTVNGDKTVGITYANQARTLTLDAFAGTGKVKVQYFRLGAAKTAEIDQATAARTIEADFDSEVKVSVLEDDANSHYSFNNWTGAEFGNTTAKQLSFLMNNNKSIGARFDKITHKLLVEAPASGYIKVAYTGYNTLKQETPLEAFVNAQSGTVAFDVVCSTDVTLEAKPVNDNYSFVNWTGAPVAGLQDKAQTFSVDKDYTVGTVFKLNTYELTVTKPENGKLKVEYFQGNVAQEILVENGATLTIDKSSEVKVQAIAADNYNFVRWTGLASTNEFNIVPNTAFVMESDATIGADFRKKTHTVKVQAPVNGSIEIKYQGYKTTSELTSAPLTETINAQSGTRTFDVVNGENAELKAIPALNYTFLAWSGTDNTSPEEQVLTNVSDDHTVGATFDIMKRNLVVAAPINGTVDIEYTAAGKVMKATATAGNSFNGQADIDTEVKLEAKDAPDYDFVKWIGSLDESLSVDKARERVITFRMSGNMTTIGTLFRAETRKLTALSPVNGEYTFKYSAYKNDESAETEERGITMRNGEGAREFNAVMFSDVTPVLRTPATNYKNVGWTGGTYADARAVAVANDMEIGAAFAIQNRTLTIERPENGQIKVEYLENNAPATIVVETEEKTLTVDLASNVKITAMAKDGYDFVMWKNAAQFANVKAEAVEFLMEGDKQIGTYFRKETRKLTAQSPVNGSYEFSYYAYANDNSLTGELRKISVPAGSGIREFEAVTGTDVTAIKRTPATNFENDAWTEAFDGANDGTAKAVAEPLTIGAKFKTIKHTLTVAAPEHGKISVDYLNEGLPKQVTLTEGQSGTYQIDQASAVNLSAAAIDNYDFVIWKGDSQFEKMDVATIQLVMDAPKSIQTLFRKETRRLTALSPVNGEYEFSYVAYKNDNSDETETRNIRLSEYSGLRELDAVLGTDVIVLDRKAYMNFSNGEWSGFGDANKNADKPQTTVTNDLTIGTLFTLNNRNLTITRPVNGSVKVEYTENKEVKSVVLTNTSSDGELNLLVDWASNVKLTAIADEYYDFLTWKGNGFDDITANHVEFMMESQADAKVITAVFRLQTRDLTVTNPVNGTIKVIYDFRKEEGQPTQEVIVENKSKITTFRVDVNSDVRIIPTPEPIPGYFWKNTYLNDLLIGENTANEAKDGATGFVMDNAKTLVVNFKAEVYTITFDSNNGSAVNDVNYTIEDEVTFAQPTRQPYLEFEGWYDNAEFTGDAVAELEKGCTGDRAYYAKWIRCINDLSIGRMWNHTLAVVNPAQDPLITTATFKWYGKDENGDYTLLDNGGKQYMTFAENNVPNGVYKVEIYLAGNGQDHFDALPIVLESEIFDAQWRVYPTVLKVGQAVNIETGMTDNSNLDVRLFNQSGNPVQSRVVEAEKGLRVESIENPGIYVIRVTSTEGEAESFKIMVGN